MSGRRLGMGMVIGAVVLAAVGFGACLRFDLVNRMAPPADSSCAAELADARDYIGDLEVEVEHWRALAEAREVAP